MTKLKTEDVINKLNEAFKSSMISFEKIESIKWAIKIRIKNNDYITEGGNLSLKGKFYDDLETELKKLGVTEDIDYNNTGNTFWSIGSWD